MHDHLIWILILVYILNRVFGWWILVYSKKIGWIGSINVRITTAVIISAPYSTIPYTCNSRGLSCNV